MATAVKKEVEVVAPPYEVTLTLSQKEAEILYALLGWKILGKSAYTPREFLDSIYHALDNVGVTSNNFHCSMKGSITCTVFE